NLVELRRILHDSRGRAEAADPRQCVGHARRRHERRRAAGGHQRQGPLARGRAGPHLARGAVPAAGGGRHRGGDAGRVHRGAAYVGDLFPGYEVRQTARFRVTRNSDLLVDEEESEDLLNTIQEELRRRELGATVRLELSAAASPDIETMLTTALKVEASDIYRIVSPLQLQDLVALEKYDSRPELRVEPLVPAVPAALRDLETPIFDVIKKSE